MNLAARIIAACIFGLALNLAAALLPERSRAPRALAVALSAAALAIPFFLPGPPLFRAILAALLGVGFCRVVEIAAAPARFGRAERAVRLLTIFETRLMKRVP